RGSGIGLAVADELVSAFSGSLELDSKLGEGTTVTIRIPNAQLYEQLQQKASEQGEEENN
ncbi:MAG: sensor histidine kinase, partial [Oscillospiraceae bacterium]|nr:sensor histidine kinase [Oscillospiraceae bacterium]